MLCALFFDKNTKSIICVIFSFLYFYALPFLEVEIVGLDAHR